MSDLDEFRGETRAWLEANCPAEMREPMRDESDVCWGGRNPDFKNDGAEAWMEAMAARGWTVPDWPKDYGGGGLSPAETKVLKQEMARIGARKPLMSFGISMLGPALLKYGNEEQKKRFLPEIARGEIRWCQGYSEPGAGSDLAALQTKCEDKGDHWLVNGQKVWTSYADKADWIFCLVRTDPAGAQASGDQLPAVRHGEPGRLDQADPADLRLFALLRDLLRRREGAQGPAGRRAQQGLGRRQISARPRARDDLRHGPWRPDASRSARRSRDALADDPMLRADVARFDVDAWPSGRCPSGSSTS